MYTLEAVVLSRQVIRDRMVRLSLFTEEFGKITAWDKKNQKADIGSVIEISLERQGKENILKKSDLRIVITGENWSYITTLQYMKFLFLLRETLAEGVMHRQIWKDLRTFSEFLRKTGQEPEKNSQKVSDILLILESRILKQLGYLDPRFYRGEDHLYDRLSQASIDDILRIQYLSQKHRDMLEGSSAQALHNSQNKL